MAVQLQIRDQTLAGATTDEYVVDLLTERITVRELIRSRVYQEVQDHNLRKPEHFVGLVQPAELECLLNGAKDGGHRPVDWQRQFEAALVAFDHRRILVLVNDAEVEDLDQEILVEPNTQVTFLKLVPLMGG
jgi:hypothetical protein